MNKLTREILKPAQFPVVALTIQFVMILAVVLNITVVRQVTGFIFLAMIPGLAMIRILKLKLEWGEMILFGVGLSVAFLMIVGLLLNLLGPPLGISSPLALIPLMVVINVLVGILLVREWHELRMDLSFGQTRRVAVCLFVCVVPPVLSVIGTMLVNAYPHTNNALLLLMLALVPTLISLAVFYRKLFPREFYPLVIYMTALALLLHVSLFSNYIHGGDIFAEYNAFKLTMNGSYWNPAASDRIYAMLSVTILPTILSTMLNLDGSYILKLFYPLLFALVPVGLYQLFKLKWDAQVALLSAFFFVANSVFFTELAELGRQMIAELFFILLFLTIFNKKIGGSVKWLCFVAFSFGLVVSHYALSYLFLGFIFAVWLFTYVKRRHAMTVTLTMVAVFAAVTFVWYIYVSSAATFNDFVRMVDHIRSSFVSDFVNPQSRGAQVLEGTGLQGLETLWHLAGRYTYYATELLIVIGILSLIIKQRRSFFNDEHNIMIFLSMALVVACIVVPNLAPSFNMTRFFHIALFFLAPMCILGGIAILGSLSRKRISQRAATSIVLLAVLIPYFFFQTGFLYEVVKDETWALPLSSYRFNRVKLAQMGVFSGDEVRGAFWLSNYKDPALYVYADSLCGELLFYQSVSRVISPFSGTRMLPSGYVYLRAHNLYYCTVFDGDLPLNITQLDPSLNETSQVYSSGLCQIYKIPD